MASAQHRFFNLSADEVKVDSFIPHVGWTVDLPANYMDSVYTVSLLYPEYIDMAPSDVEKYHVLTSDPLPAVPSVEWSIGFEKKSPKLVMDVCPLACQDGKYKFLVGYMLKVETQGAENNAKGMKKAAVAAADRYAENSVLATGNWAKIRVPETGVYQLTEALIKKAGFTDLNKIKVYGYGGNLQNEKLVADELIATDDLKEVEQCIVGGKHFFYAKGPVSWKSKTSTERIRNPYSDYGYYFITQTDEAPVVVDEERFKSLVYPEFNDYHAITETDGFAWYNGGRNLYDPNPLEVGASKTYTLPNKGMSKNGTMNIVMTAGVTSTVQVEVNGEVAGTVSINVSTSSSSHSVAGSGSKAVVKKDLDGDVTVKLTPLTGGPVHLDYIAVAYTTPAPFADLASSSMPVPEYVHRITNQNHHADAQADMVIIIPTSQKVLAQAERLKAMHVERDGMRVNIVPADELYNEFASGTPDANAYRRYLKMLYDRAETEDDQPKFLLLMGDCLWDNRMLLPAAKALSPDNYLLCYESENSMSHTECVVDDGWFGLLDDGEGDNAKVQLADVAVGRFPVTNESAAKIMVDKTISYAKNENAGAWQNTIMVLGDDGDGHIHMASANIVADLAQQTYPGYLVKKVMWDTYLRESSAVGNTYPEVSRMVKQQQQAGALIMNYAGHGSPTQMSHETVLRITDFAGFTNTNYPLWFTASCDIMPFDGFDDNIGETAVLNPKGGTMAFVGTARTVYAPQNETLNKEFIVNVLRVDDNGKANTIGNALRESRNAVIKKGSDTSSNKLHYALLGDPALALNLSKGRVVVDAINGVPVGTEPLPQMKAGSTASVEGHIENNDTFNGVVSITVRDTEETIHTRLNDKGPKTPKDPFVYTDRPKTLFSGSNVVKDGRFQLDFVVPIDINYADDKGLITLFAHNDEKDMLANGRDDSFIVGGSADLSNDKNGPSIYCYLNSPSFVNGGDVNATPYFVAQINDNDGLNTSGNGIGHDLQLIVDGEMTKTYVLNDNFTYDFGSYTSGSTFYSIPQLPEGPHRLQFRAWDVFNNSTTTTLDFNVVKALEPKVFSVSCTNNPATTNTTFIVAHDRQNSEVTTTLDVMDMSGRVLWSHRESGVATDGTYRVDWDLTVDDGHSLQTGVYLYRASIACDGSSYASKAKKLIIIK